MAKVASERFGVCFVASQLEAMAAEFFFTFNLSFVVLAVAVSALTKTSHFFGLAIGFCVARRASSAFVNVEIQTHALSAMPSAMVRLRI